MGKGIAKKKRKRLLVKENPRKKKKQKIFRCSKRHLMGVKKVEKPQLVTQSVSQLVRQSVRQSVSQSVSSVSDWPSTIGDDGQSVFGCV